MKEVIRSYCVFVLLGMPPQKGFRLLVHYCRRARTVLYAEHLSFSARLTSATLRPMPPSADMLLKELSALADKFEGKVLTLVPTTPQSMDFVEKYRDVLEEQYRIDRISPKIRKPKGTNYETEKTL